MSNIITIIGAFFKGAWTAWRAARSAKAGGELADGKKAVDAVDANVEDLRAEIKREGPSN